MISAQILIPFGAFIIGVLLSFLICKSKSAKLEERLVQKEEGLLKLSKIELELSEVSAQKSRLEATLEQEKKSSEEKLKLLEKAKEELSNSFKALSADALKTNNESFIELAKVKLEKFQETAKGDLEKKQQAITELVKPIKESLEKVGEKIEEVEKSRRSAYGSLSEQVKSLAEAQVRLHTETSKLSTALQAPTVRGSWGEIQLRRVVEMAGMVKYCDFDEQQSADSGRLRPDMIIRLPNGKNIVVDSKTPLDAYLEASNESDFTRKKEQLQRHAKQVRTHLNELGNKSYWEQFKPTPEFVVLFLPGETFFSAALEADPSLIEYGNDRKVILATPTTLIALLKAVAFGWRQEELTENASAISELGAQLYERVGSFAGHFVSLGKGLDRAIDSYNSAVGSLERKVLVSARKFKDLGAGSSKKEIPALEVIETTPRALQAEELSDSQPSELSQDS